jgi:TolB protein
MEAEDRKPGSVWAAMTARRAFLKAGALSALAAAAGCVHGPVPAREGKQRLFFTSRGKTCLIHADGTGLRTLELDAPNQVTWQPAGFLEDGRVLLLSMEPRLDGPGRPFEEY